MSAPRAVQASGRRTRALLRPGHGALAALVAVSLAVTATYVGQGLLVADAFGDVLASRPLTDLVAPLIVIVALQGIRGALLVVREVRAARTATTVKLDLRRRLTAKLLDLGPGEVRRRRTGELQAVLVDVVEKVEPYVVRFLPQAIASMLGALGIAVILVSLDPVVGGAVVVCAVAVPMVPALSERLVRRRMDPWWAAYRGMYAEGLDAVQGMTTLKLFGATRRWGDDLHQRAERFCTDSIRLCGIVVVYVGVVGALVGIGTALAVGLGALRRVDGLISTADLLVVLLLTRECFRPLTQLQEAFHSAAPARSAAATIGALLDSRPAVGDPPSAVPLPAGPPTLTFDGVSFAYPDRSSVAVAGIDLHVHAGEHVAVVGRSGAGKTTLVSLLLRFYDPDAGRVLMAGHDLCDLALADLRRHVALVSQDTYLFNGTVRDNVALSLDDPDDAVLWETLADAQATFVEHLPEGLDTIVGERGTKLSGGERQRLAIARALLVDAPVLVMDEATSSLDAANEVGLTDALRRLSQGRTTLTIAHRLSTVRHADRIVVLEAGRVAEVGPWNALVDGNGPFSRLAAAGVVGS